VQVHQLNHGSHKENQAYRLEQTIVASGHYSFQQYQVRKTEFWVITAESSDPQHSLVRHNY